MIIGIAKTIVFILILSLVVWAFKAITKNKAKPESNEDVVDLEKDKDGKYKPKNKK